MNTEDEVLATTFRMVRAPCIDTPSLVQSLPEDIQFDSFVKFAGTYFQKGRVFAMAFIPLPTSLLQLNKKDETKALIIMSLVSTAIPVG